MKRYARLTIDMTPEEHTYLKMASAQLGISMRRFMLLAAFQKMLSFDDEWLVSKAEEAMEQLSSSKEKAQTIDEKDMSLT